MSDEFEFERGEILINLTLLEDHAVKFPCSYCMEKHSSKIIGYAEEIALGEKNKDMEKLAEQARDWRRQIQGAKTHKHEHADTCTVKCKEKHPENQKAQIKCVERCKK